LRTMATLCQSIVIRGVMSQSRICCRPMLGIRALEIQQPCMSFRGQRSNISTNVPSRQTNLVRADEKKSLAWVQLHDRSPASYGILTTSAYEELIPSGTPLPCSKTQKFQTSFDYLKGATFDICYRQSTMGVPITIKSVNLAGIRFAKKGVPRVKATLMLGKDLIGKFTVEDTFTKSVASAVFDGSVPPRAERSHEAISKNSDSSV